ncbi:hypothetical protein HK405_012813 [Cladochytrium tenue]|nr:hypothetical protein HK405_012813 [Cladochytrium tenue]
MSSDTDVMAPRATSAAGTLPLYDRYHRKRSAPSIGSVPHFDIHPPPTAPSTTAAPAPTTPVLQLSPISAASGKMAIAPATSAAQPALPLTREQQLSRLDDDLLRIDFDDVTVAHLKEVLRRRGLPSSGRKAKLLDRIRFEVAQLHRTRLQDPAAASSASTAATSAASPSGSPNSSRSASPASSSRSAPSPPLLSAPAPSAAPTRSYRGGGASPVVPASRPRSRGSPSGGARGPRPASAASTVVVVAAPELAGAPADAMLVDTPTTANVASASGSSPEAATPA